MTEIRKISRNSVRSACIKYNFYTCGDCEEYENMLTYVDLIYNATTSEIETIAADIKKHSDTEYELTNIMFILANECCTSFFQEG